MFQSNDNDVMPGVAVARSITTTIDGFCVAGGGRRRGDLIWRFGLVWENNEQKG
jgi:hypothetical protein